MNFPRDYPEAMLGILAGCLIIFAIFIWPKPFGELNVLFPERPSPVEACTDHGGIRQVSVRNGWGSDPYVVCLDGYGTGEVAP